MNEPADKAAPPASAGWAEFRDLDLRTRAFGLDAQAFGRAFPFCLHLDAQLRVCAAGASLLKAYPEVQLGVALADLFTVRRPRAMSSIEAWRRHAGQACTLVAQHPTKLILRGNVELFDDGTLLMMLAPILTSLEDMSGLGLTFNDFARHDASVDLLMLAQTARASVHDAVHLAHRLQARTEQLNTILELSTSAVVYFDAAGAVQHANAALLDMLALERIAAFDLTIAALDRWIGGLLDPQDRNRRPLTELMRHHPSHRPVAESTATDVPHREPNQAGAADEAIDRDSAAPAVGGSASSANRTESETATRRFTGYGLGDQTASDATMTLHFGRPRAAVIHLGAARSEGGGWVFYLRDVTHETEVDRMKSEFLATAAHELRTPMVSVFGFTELLLNRPVPEAQRRDMLETIHRQSKLLINMVNEMLDLARIEARQGRDMQPVACRLSELIEPALVLFDAPGGQQRRRVQLQLAPGHAGLRVQVDIDRMRRVVTNVLANAFKYAPGTSAIRLDSRDGTLHGAAAVGLRVTDTGIGMTREQAARVFERFFRADPSGNTPGTGLGMSLVKEIMELHGGRVDIASELGRGTAVTLWWPVMQDATRA